MNTTFERTVQSLHVLLNLAVPHAAQQSNRSARMAATRLRMLDETTGFPEGQSQIEALIADPIGAAYLQAMQRLGEYLFTMDGTTTLMRYASELLLDLDPAELATRANLIDLAWAGVGRGRDRWVS